MVNSTQKFLRGGGTKVITNKSEIKKVVIKDLRRSTGGGSSSSSSSSSSGDGGAAARAAEAARAREQAAKLQADIERAAKQDRAREAAQVAAEQKKQVEIRAVQRREEKSLATISAVEKRTDFKERPLASFQRLQSKATTQSQRTRGQKGLAPFKAGAISTALGFASPFVHLTSAAINPIDTATALKGSLSDPKGTGKAIKSSLVTSFQTDPSFATGALLGEVALLKAPTGITKTTDFVRTGRLSEVPTSSVVAPEFFKGQTFPLIKKGQTAGELLKEFKIEGAGFTASPKPFAKTTIAGEGSSEIAGVFQAPKVSPRFLRVGGEERPLLSLSITDTLRPTVTRTTPTDFKLAVGVSPKQSKLAGIKQSKTFIETKAPKGQSTIPFIKTEKESIITAGTELKKTGSNVFFEFEGRKVPIKEFEALGDAKNIGKVKGRKKISTIEEVSASSSRGRIGQRGVISPLEIVSSSKGLRSSSRGGSSSRGVSSSGRSMASSGKSVISSSIPSRISSSPLRPSPSSISSILSSRGISSRGSSSGRGSISGRPIITPVVPIKLSKPKKQTKETSDIFGVSVRRRGKFKSIGKGLSLKKALSVGKGRVEKTLAATFRIEGNGKGLTTPTGFRTKGTKGGILFIEKRGRRLSTGGETREILQSKKRGLY